VEQDLRIQLLINWSLTRLGALASVCISEGVGLGVEEIASMLALVSEYPSFGDAPMERLLCPHWQKIVNMYRLSVEIAITYLILKGR
jgi:hypothetical protein